MVTSLFIQNKHQDTLNSVLGSTNSYKIASEVTPTKTFVNAESIIEKTVGIRNLAGVEEVPHVFTRELAADESLAIDVTEDATDGFVILSDKVQDDANRKKSAADITNTEQSPSLMQFKNPQTEIRLDQETRNSALSDTSSIMSAIAEEVNFQSKPSHDHHKEQHQEASNEPHDLTQVVTSSVLSNIIVSRANPQSTSSVDHHAELLPAEDASFIMSSLAKLKQVHPHEHHLNHHARLLQTKDADSTSSASTVAIDVHIPAGIAHEVTPPAPVAASRMHSVAATSIFNPPFRSNHPEIRKRRHGGTPADATSNKQVTRMATSNQSFLSKDELKGAVDNYVTQDCANLPDCDVGQIYGWPMNAWCVSNVTDMSWLFYSMPYFNENISSWDVSNVVNMDYMFYYAQAFNDDLSGWDVSNVVNMYYMFCYAQAFNGDLSGWNVSNVVNMDYMFYYAQAFNGDLSGWNVSGVSYMAGMFLYAKSFNQNLCSWANVFPYNSASSIFAESNCTYRSDPLLFRGGSFCASMCADLPFILDVLPSDASDTGGIKIRLLGYNFVSSHATNTSTSFECQFGSAAKVNASLISNKELNCVSPIVSLLNGALEVDLFVIIDGQMSFNSVPFQFYGLCPENQCNNGYCSFGQCEVSLHTVVATF